MEEPESSKPTTSQAKMTKEKTVKHGITLSLEEDYKWAKETEWEKKFPPELFHDHMYAWPGQTYNPKPGDPADPPKEELPPIVGVFDDERQAEQDGIVVVQQETPKATSSSKFQMDVLDSGTVFQRNMLTQPAASHGPPILHRAGGITMNDAAATALPNQHPIRIPIRQGPPHRIRENATRVIITDGRNRGAYAAAERRMQVQYESPPGQPPVLVPQRQTVPIVQTSSPPRKNQISFNEALHEPAPMPMRRPAILRPPESKPSVARGVRSNLPLQQQATVEPRLPGSPRKEEVLPAEIKNLAQSLRLNPPAGPGGSRTSDQFAHRNLSLDSIRNKIGHARPAGEESPEPVPAVLPTKPVRILPPGRQPPAPGRGAMIRVPGSSPIRTNLDFNSQLKSTPMQTGVKSNLPPRPPISPTKSPKRGRPTKKAAAQLEDELEEEIEMDEDEEEEEDNKVRCICRAEDDLEVLGWVQCDRCKFWQHAACGGYDPIKEANKQYFCHLCEPQANRPNRKTYKQAMEFLKKARQDAAIEEASKKKSKAGGNKRPSELDVSSPSSSSKSTISNTARNWLRNAGLDSNFTGPFALGSCSKLTVAEQAKGLVANQPIARGTGVVEIVAHICVPTEIHQSDLLNPLIFKYNALNKQRNLPIQEQAIVCLDTRKISHDGRSVRRCCRPNSTIRHCYAANAPNFHIVTKQDIEKREEITIPFDCGYRPSNKNECRCYGVDDANCLLNDPNFVGPGFIETSGPLPNPIAPLTKNKRREKMEAAKSAKEEKSEEETPVEPATQKQRTISRSPVKSPRREDREMRPSPSVTRGRRLSERERNDQIAEEISAASSPASPKRPVSPKKTTAKKAKEEAPPSPKNEPIPAKKIKTSPIKEDKPSTSRVFPEAESKIEGEEKNSKPKSKTLRELESLNQFNTNFAVPGGQTDREKRKLEQEMARFGEKKSDEKAAPKNASKQDKYKEKIPPAKKGEKETPKGKEVDKKKAKKRQAEEDEQSTFSASKLKKQKIEVTEKSTPSSIAKKTRQTAKNEAEEKSTPISKKSKPIAKNEVEQAKDTPSFSQKSKKSQEKVIPSSKKSIKTEIEMLKKEDSSKTPVASSSTEVKTVTPRGFKKNMLDRFNQENGVDAVSASPSVFEPSSSTRPMRTRIPTQKIKEQKEDRLSEVNKKGQLNSNQSDEKRNNIKLPVPSSFQLISSKPKAKPLAMAEPKIKTKLSKVTKNAANSRKISKKYQYLIKSIHLLTARKSFPLNKTKISKKIFKLYNDKSRGKKRDAKKFSSGPSAKKTKPINGRFTLKKTALSPPHKGRIVDDLLGLFPNVTAPQSEIVATPSRPTRQSARFK